MGIFQNAKHAPHLIALLLKVITPDTVVGLFSIMPIKSSTAFVRQAGVALVCGVLAWFGLGDSAASLLLLLKAGNRISRGSQIRAIHIRCRHMGHFSWEASCRSHEKMQCWVD
jgi:hypothetical protein